MAYTLTLHEEPRYLHAVVTGANSEEAVKSYMDELLRECVARECSQLLIEEHLRGQRLDAFEVFRVACDGVDHVGNQLRAIAYVDANARGDLMRFAETVAVNRGLNVAVFPSVGDAQAWLSATP